jgi:hypothetical protein
MEKIFPTELPTQFFSSLFLGFASLASFTSMPMSIHSSDEISAMETDRRMVGEDIEFAINQVSKDNNVK